MPGLSVDSTYAHIDAYIAWLRTIREKFAVEVPFPVVEPPPETMLAAEADAPLNGECVDWYFRRRGL